MTGGKEWQIGLIALVAIFLVAMITTLTVAKRKASRVVDPEYYSHGLRYGSDRDRLRNPGVDWHMTTSLSEGCLELVVKDRSGAAVSKGTAAFSVEPDAIGRKSPEFLFSEVKAGVYRLPHPLPQHTSLKGSVRFVKGEGHVVGKVVVLN